MEPESNSAFDAATDPVTRRFLPGNNANPLGQASRKLKIRAEYERLTVEFCNRYGRVPDAFEIGIIGNAALLHVRLSKCRMGDHESAAKLANAYDRCLRRLGMNSAPTRAPAATPRPRP